MTLASTRPAAKGWCPDAYRPMASGDGLILRLRPRFGTLSPAQFSLLADLAEQFCHGQIELTSRGSLQLRGLSAEDIAPLQEALRAAGLIDSNPQTEAKRSAIFASHASAPQADATIAAFYARLDELPDLPAKFCFGFDFTGLDQLGLDACDIVIRHPEPNAIDAAIETAHWFMRTGGAEVKRMRHHDALHSAPSPIAPPTSHTPQVGHGTQTIAAAPFGLLSSATLRALGAAAYVRFCYGRRILIEGTAPQGSDLITDPSHPLLRVHCCAGAPQCTAAQIETRRFAAQIAEASTGTLHISGCTKGCAYPHTADVTLVGQNGAFDLVRGGYPWDEPHETGLSAEDILSREELT